MLQQSQLFGLQVAQAAQNRVGVLVFWGYVEYRDIFFPKSKLHHIHYCNAISVQGTPGNYSFSFPFYQPDCNTTD